jgi:hypothetical protein
VVRPVVGGAAVGDLDRLAAVHDQHVVGHVGDHAEVVGDDDDGRAELVLQPLDQVEDLGLHGHVQGGGRLVGDQHGRVERERHGDHRPLPHPARELVRVVVDAALGPRDADQAQQLDGAVARVLLGLLLVRQDHLGDLGAHLVERVQARERVLEDHRDLLAADLPDLVAVHLEQVVALEQGLPGDLPAAGQPHDRQAGHALAGAGLAHDAEGLAPVEGEVDAVHRLDDAVVGAEPDPQVLDFEQ